MNLLIKIVSEFYEIKIYNKESVLHILLNHRSGGVGIRVSKLRSKDTEFDLRL